MEVKSESEVAQSCLTLSDPWTCSLPDSSVHGIFQARVLEWGAIAFSLKLRYRELMNSQCSRRHSPERLSGLFSVVFVGLGCRITVLQ